MKKLLLLPIAFMLAIGFTSCNNDDDDQLVNNGIIDTPDTVDDIDKPNPGGNRPVTDNCSTVNSFGVPGSPENPFIEVDRGIQKKAFTDYNKLSGNGDYVVNSRCIPIDWTNTPKNYCETIASMNSIDNTNTYDGHYQGMPITISTGSHRTLAYGCSVVYQIHREIVNGLLTDYVIVKYSGRIAETRDGEYHTVKYKADNIESEIFYWLSQDYNRIILKI